MLVGRLLPEKCTWVMAFDFGTARIGVAVGNTLLKIPHPLSIITGHNKFDKFAKIGKLIDEWRPSQLVVGIPENNEDKQQFIAIINKFGNRLKHNFHLPLSFVNEDYSSAIASDMLVQQKIRGIKQKKMVDEVAACLILQRYFDIS